MDLTGKSTPKSDHSRFAKPWRLRLSVGTALLVACFAFGCDQAVRTPSATCTAPETRSNIARLLLMPTSDNRIISDWNMEQWVLSDAQLETATSWIAERISAIVVVEVDDTTQRVTCAARLEDGTGGEPISYSVFPLADGSGYAYQLNESEHLSIALLAMEALGYDPQPISLQELLTGQLSARPPTDVSSTDGAAQVESSALPHDGVPTVATFPYFHNGPDATIERITGVGTPIVSMEARVTTADIDRWCREHEGDANCPAGWQPTPSFSVRADCESGRMQWSPGNQFHQVIGRDEYGYVFEDMEGRLYASFNQDAAVKFAILCPGASFGNLQLLPESE